MPNILVVNTKETERSSITNDQHAVSHQGIVLIPFPAPNGRYSNFPMCEKSWDNKWNELKKWELLCQLLEKRVNRRKSRKMQKGALLQRSKKVKIQL